MSYTSPDLRGSPNDVAATPKSAEWQFSDDATLAPEDSVSNLVERVHTRGPFGPRKEYPIADYDPAQWDIPSQELHHWDIPAENAYVDPFKEKDLGDVLLDDKTATPRSASTGSGRQKWLPSLYSNRTRAEDDQELQNMKSPLIPDQDRMDEKADGPGPLPPKYDSPAGGMHYEYTQDNESLGNEYFSRDVEEQTPHKKMWPRRHDSPESREALIEQRRMGHLKQRTPFLTYLLIFGMVITFIVELVRMKAITGSAIQTKPSFNPMIGPSGTVLINLGARFDGCIKSIPDVSDIDWVCPAESNENNPSSDNLCSMEQVCGFSQSLDQWFRFILPVFLHAGVIHLVLNMMAMYFSSAYVERMLGSPNFFLLYFSSGIFGFILGGNFALVGQPSVGASGAIFGTNAALLVDLILHWQIEIRPVRKLALLLLETVCGLLLGLAPGIDNFAHIGGFAVGILASIILVPVIHLTPRHKIATIVSRVLALPLIIIMFVLLLRNFYSSDDPSATCSWCRYLSCWPTASNNHCNGIGLSSTSTSSLYISGLIAIAISLCVARANKH